MWGGAVRRFRLGIGELRRIEAQAGRGIFEVMDRLAHRSATIDETRAVLKFGLEGAGIDPNEAERDVARYFDEAPKTPSLPIASLVLMAALYPPEDAAPSGKAEGDGTSSATAFPSP
nr:gene transfer agent family protein [Acuticoccus kalidii]